MLTIALLIIAALALSYYGLHYDGYRRIKRYERRNR